MTKDKTYLVTEGKLTLSGTSYTAGQTITPGTTASYTATGATAFVELEVITNAGNITSLADGKIDTIPDTKTMTVTAGKSYLITKGSISYEETVYTVGSAFTAVTGKTTATATSASEVFKTATDFVAGELIEKAAGLYIGPSAKLVNYESPAVAAQQIVAKLQAEGITGLNFTDNIDGTFDIILGGNLSVASATDSHKAINSIDLAMQMVSADRAMFGALSNRFDISISNLSNVAASSEMSLGRMQDADFAAETSRMTTSRILEQASIAMMVQANAAKQNVLKLLG